MPARPASSTQPPDGSPLYLQLARQLESDIRTGTYRVDQALPSERMLSESLGVSRITARKAIDVLVEQGLVVRKHGSGNFIAPRIEQPTSKLASFSEELRQRGYVPASQWITRETGVATVPEREALGLPLLDDPDLLLVPEHGAQAAGWFWHRAGCNELMDRAAFEEITKARDNDFFELVTRRINGGLIGHEDGNDAGVDDRVEHFKLARRVLTTT